MYFRIISLHIIARSQLADYRNKNYDFIKLTTLDPQKEVLLQSLEVEAAKLWSFSCNSWVFFWQIYLTFSTSCC